MNRAIDAGFEGKTLEEAEGLVPAGRAERHRPMPAREALMPKITFKNPHGPKSTGPLTVECKRGLIDPRCRRGVRRARRPRLRWQPRVLDVPRLRRGGPRLARPRSPTRRTTSWTRRSTCDPSRASAARRRSPTRTSSSRSARSRCASWLDENPDERKRLAARSGPEESRLEPGPQAPIRVRLAQSGKDLRGRFGPPISRASSRPLIHDL